MSLLKRLLALAVWGATSTDVTAQPGQDVKTGPLVIPLTVDAIAPPTPAMKYRLLPHVRDQHPGNRVRAFTKCSAENREWLDDPAVSAARDRWLAAPIEELAGQRELVGYGGTALKSADAAARLDYTDWGLTDALKSDGRILIESEGAIELRKLTAAIKVRMRGEIARKEFDAAVNSAQTLFALAHVMADHPAPIANIVGMAITSVALDGLEEFVRQPGAPNLFWALADLPETISGVRKGLQGERMFLGKEFEVLAKPDRVGQDVLKRLAETLDPYLKWDEDYKEIHGTVWDRYSKRAGDANAVKQARLALVSSGFDRAKTDDLTDLQVIMAEEYRYHLASLDQVTTWSNTPFWRLPSDAGRKKPQTRVFADTSTSLFKVLQARVRAQQRIALLQAVEAVRAHAAEHAGGVPATLDDVTLPIPVDPVTGKAFRYESKNGTAVLRGTPPADRKDEPAFNRVYEVTIRK